MSEGMEVFRKVPWTCQWGEFGGAPSLETGGYRSQASSPGCRRWSPWVCVHPQVRPEGGYLSKGECDHCPFWTRPVDRAAS
jgi:hypothetical protein